MAEPQPPQPMPVPGALNIIMPPDRVEGHYADFANIWHNQETFILDFLAMATPPHPGQTPDGITVIQTDAQVVTRVRIPAAQVWEVMKALQTQLGAWEAENPDRVPPQPNH